MKKGYRDRVFPRAIPLQEGKGRAVARPLRALAPSLPEGLWKAGIFSFLLHGFLVLGLICNVPSGLKESRSPFYRVTLRPLQPLKEETHENPVHSTLGRRAPVLPANVKAPEKKIDPVQKVNPGEVLVPEKKAEKKTPDPVEPAVARTPLEEQKTLPLPQETEETIREPIPLPMAASSQADAPSNPELEDDPLTLLSSSRIEEDPVNATLGKGPGDGPGTGFGSGAPGATGEGAGGGQGDSEKEGTGIKLGAGPGGSGSGIVAKSQGVGKGAPGPGSYGLKGSGNQEGSGQGRTGSGNSGNDGSGVPHPRYAVNPKPVYPREARERRYEGEVVLKVEVLSNGRVGQIEVKRSSGYEMLDQSAFAAVKQWRFIPAMQGDVAIPFWVNIPIRFRLL